MNIYGHSLWTGILIFGFEKLEYLGYMTLNYLFKHEAVSRVAILTDMQTPKEKDNTNRPMQQVFLRHKAVSSISGVDLNSE